MLIKAIRNYNLAYFCDWLIGGSVIVPPQSLFPPKEPEEALALDGPPLLPIDPSECRQRALDCVRMSQSSNTLEAREIWFDLAKTWLRLHVIESQCISL